MDAEHRHELKTNELANFLAHSGEFFRKNYLQIIGVILIIAGIFLWSPVKSHRQNAELNEQAKVSDAIEQVAQSKMTALQGVSQNMGISNALLVTANVLETEAKGTKNPLLGALALIKRGEALRADLHYRTTDVEAAIVSSQIKQAKNAYTQAIAKAEGEPGGAGLVAMAKFGLGLCAEELGDRKQAKSIYQAIVTDTQYEGTIFPAQAQLRIETMDDSKGKFVFAPDPVVSEFDLPEKLKPGTAESIVIEPEPQAPSPEAGTN